MKKKVRGLIARCEVYMGISIFIDNSNIWLVGRNVCSKKEPGDEYGFRIHFKKLIEFVANGREINYAFAAGSVPPPNDSLWTWLKSNNVKLELQERGSSGKEVSVDGAVHLALLERTLDIKNSNETFVLLTGDGAGYNDGKGFIRQLERVKAAGHNIEVVSWDEGCNRNLRDFANKNGIYRSLEPVYEEISFIENKRWAK